MGHAFGGQSSRHPFAWTYRDWVVKSLHDDVPYDRFVTLQLAADRIEPPVPREDLAALGFLTVGRTFLGNTHDIIDDRIDLVTRGEDSPVNGTSATVVRSVSCMWAQAGR